MQLLVVVLAVCVLGANAGLDPKFLEKLTQEVQAVGTSCGEKEHATADDMIEIMEEKFPPTSHEAKCVVACFYKHYKMMKEDGTFDKDAAVKAFDEIKAQDAEIHAKILKVIDACDAKKQMSDDHCVSAASMAGCVKTEAIANGLTKEAFMAS
ncbi:odorant binding protein 16 [Tribolium castaneum]|uniref:Odorant binding protein 16 n=2 Tax=Tribolium castaneum TaxID=7070 RepID=D2A1T1_TRICA|nr:odorant binding protein 16 [Tribolium castaneum]